jgi:hypothetical protein
MVRKQNNPQGHGGAKRTIFHAFLKGGFNECVAMRSHE